MVMNTKNYFISRHGRILGLLALFLFVVGPVPAWAAVALQLDRDRVMVGETVTLTFITHDSSQSLDIDFSVLEDDFEILDRRKEAHTSIVNGGQTSDVRLILRVEPKRDGDIQVPAFAFGSNNTAPVTLRVDPAPEQAPGALPPVFIEVELNPGEDPYYVHAQFGLVVRVFYQQNLTEAARRCTNIQTMQPCRVDLEHIKRVRQFQSGARHVWVRRFRNNFGIAGNLLRRFGNNFLEYNKGQKIRN